MKRINYLFSVLFILGISLTSAKNTTNLVTNSGKQGDHNRFTGYNNGSSITTGLKNTFIGSTAIQNNTSEFYNVYLGYTSGTTNTTSSRNVFLGSFKRRFNISSSFNRFTSHSSSERKTTVGFNNFLGSYTGSYNTFLGNRAAYLSNTGTGNVYLGNYAGYKNKNSKSVFIDCQTGYIELGVERLYIDNSSTSTSLIYGDFTTNQLGVNSYKIPTGYTFTVKRKMIGEEFKIKLQADAWLGFVFNKEYNLPTLIKVEKYVKKKGHLQNIPNAKEVAKNGILLGEMNAKLLQKVEELYLYTIQQEKELQNRKQINKTIEERLQKIEFILNNK